jgi:hypothetical protein
MQASKSLQTCVPGLVTNNSGNWENELSLRLEDDDSMSQGLVVAEGLCGIVEIGS